MKKNPGKDLYSLGAIVHNEEELARLSGKGLVAIDYDDLDDFLDDWDGCMPDGSDAEDYWGNW